MDFTTIILPVALFMVGFTQLLKQFFEPKDKKVKILITIAVGIIGGIIKHFVPDWVFQMLLSVSFGVVFYDYFLKYIEKVLDGLNNHNSHCKCRDKVEELR